MINLKSALEKDEDGKDIPTIVVDGRQIIVFNLEDTQYQYSSNTVLSQEIVEIIQQEIK